MAITLMDELALEQSVMRKGIIQALVEQVMLQDKLQWSTVGALQLPVTYLSGIPQVPLRHINETPAGVQAYFAQMVESLNIIDTDIDIDPVLVAVKNQITPIEVAQTKAVVSSIGYRVNDLFINGDPASDAREPRGLKVRLRDDARLLGQTVNVTGTSTTPLDVKPATIATAATTGNAYVFLNKVDELLALVPNTSFMLMGRQATLAFWSMLRAAKLLDVTKDQFDRQIGSYRGVPFLDPGFKPAYAITGSPDAVAADAAQILGFDSEVFTAGADPGVGGGATAYAHSNIIYAVRTGDDFLASLQLEPLRVKALGETEAAPHYVRTNIRWVVNPCAPMQKRCVGRLIGFTVGT